MSPKHVISVVERGWRGARECAVVLNEAGVPVTHLIKGWIGRDVQEMILSPASQPEAGPVGARIAKGNPLAGERMIGSTPKQRVIAWPRPVFYAGLWLWLAPRMLLGRVRWVLVDHERTYRGLARWAGWCGVRPVMIQEGERGFTLRRNGVCVTVDELMTGRR